MQKNVLNVVLFLLMAGGMLVAWNFLDKQLQPPPKTESTEKKDSPKPPKDAASTIAGTAVVAAGPLADLPALPAPKAVEVVKAPEVKAPEVKQPEKPKPVATPSEPHVLLNLGDDSYYLKGLLNSKGAGLQQLVLTRFDEANRIGREAKEADGKPRKLHLIPGFHRPLPTKVSEEPEIIPLAEGTVTPELSAKLTEPAYVIYHYVSEDDPLRQAPDAGRMNDDYPSYELGLRTWKKIRDEKTDDTHTVTFETNLGAPYFLTLQKTFRLKKTDYHIGFSLEIVPGKERQAGKGRFKYQMAGARGMPVEGEWYATTQRTAYIGRQEKKYPDRVYREQEDAGTINQLFGSEKFQKPDGRLIFAATGTQYFASVMAVDLKQEIPAEGYWDYCRATRENWQNKVNERPQFDDISVRAVTPAMDITAVTKHHYVLYHGPIKVRQLDKLKYLKGDNAVSEELVDWYANTLGLKTLTDYHSPTAIGRFANSIYWADVVIASTNIMHSVLGFLHRIVPVWGIDIMLLTIIVRLILLIPSRKQQMMGAKMSAKITALQPEIDKLKEKHGDDFNAFNQEKTKLLLKNGAINPGAQMGGCLLVFAQMPIFMGLYFCLQESVFFRLEPFLFIPNLAAPDMLLGWSEGIPILSDPDNRSGFFSFLYLGPFFNILPILTVSLMAINQKLSMPPATDDMQRQQFKIMQWMMVLMGLFFYKVAAGLCVYFLCSSLWSLMERKLIPKPTVKPEVLANPGETNAPKETGGLMGRLRAKVEEMQKQAEEQSKRQIRHSGSVPKKDNKKKRK